MKLNLRAFLAIPVEVVAEGWVLFLKVMLLGGDNAMGTIGADDVALGAV